MRVEEAKEAKVRKSYVAASSILLAIVNGEYRQKQRRSARLLDYSALLYTNLERYLENFDASSLSLRPTTSTFHLVFLSLSLSNQSRSTV